MGKRLAYPVLVILAVWVGVTAVRIEVLNAEAGFFLPRQDNVGKWRRSIESTPRDRLRGLVGTIGLFQYLFAPAVIALAGILSRRQDSAGRRLTAVSCGMIGLAALGFAFYRAYFTSLGW